MQSELVGEVVIGVQLNIISSPAARDVGMPEALSFFEQEMNTKPANRLTTRMQRFFFIRILQLIVAITKSPQ